MAAKSVRTNCGLTIQGWQTAKQIINTTVEGIAGISKPLPLLSILGSLTTRTDNDTGVVTVGTGHGLVDSDTLAVAWRDGNGDWAYRYGVDITAHTGTTISINVGSGTNLPIATTAVYLAKKVNEPISVAGASAGWDALSMTAKKDAILAVLNFAADGITATAWPIILLPNQGLFFVSEIVSPTLGLSAAMLIEGTFSPTEDGTTGITSVDLYNLSSLVNQFDLAIGY